MKHYFFSCEGTDSYGYPGVSTQNYVHESEVEARREIIHILNSMDFYPRKITLLKTEEWYPIFD